MSGGTLFHTTPPDWFPQVADLRPGEKRRVGNGLLAGFNGKGYTVWRFREQLLEVYEPVMTLQEKLAHIAARREADMVAAESRTPPLPMMEHPQDWPNEARVWMHKAGISNDDIASMGAYWNPRIERVVVPYDTLDGGRAWIARKPGPPSKLTPKYLFPVGTKRGGGAVFLQAWGEPHDVIVLTEDVLSAYRVSRAYNAAAVAVQGTSLDRDAIVRLASWGRPVVTWLDPDSYGQHGAAQIGKAFARLGARVVNVKTELDPKYYSAVEIDRYVREALA